MDKLNFNIVTDCGSLKRTIIRYKGICYIGCFKGTKEEAIEAITKKYNGEASDAYIAKIKELYSKDITESDVDITTDDNYALKWVAKHGHLNIVKYLVSQGADISARDNTPVIWASSNGHLEVVKYLVSQGADIAANDNYAIRWASNYGHLDVVKYLVSQGASLES
jgi:3-polyprenyl-4-hydroxybenzoate decarboxylase